MTKFSNKEEIHLINKEIFLLFLQLMEELRVVEENKYYIIVLKKILKTITENINQLMYYEQIYIIIRYLTKIVVYENINFEERSYIYQLLRNLVKMFSKQFSYNVEYIGDSCKKYKRDISAVSRENLIQVLCIDKEKQIVESQADLILTKEDLIQELCIACPMDEFRYNRLYLQSWLQFSKKVIGVISGLSYVQYGIEVEQLKYPTANIAVGGMDINYSILMVYKFIFMYPDIKYVILPISYYEGFYDMNSSGRTYHKIMLERVILPVLMDRIVLEYDENNSIFSSIFNMNKLKDDYEEDWKIKLSGRSYFNEFHRRSGYGVLLSDCKKNSEEENYQQAMKTVKGNESVYNEENKTKILECLRNFLNNMEEKGIKVLFFTPPTTKYIFEKMDSIIEENFYKYYVPFLKQYTCCTYLDYYRDTEFSFLDFEDYEHLGESGAYKLTKKINEWIVWIMGG